MLTADDILKDDDLPIEKVSVWGGEVCVATLTAEERDRMEVAFGEVKKDDGNRIGFRAFVVATCLCDEQRKFIFPEPEKVYHKIGARGIPGVQKVFNVASRLNGITKSDEEELEKKC